MKLTNTRLDPNQNLPQEWSSLGHAFIMRALSHPGATAVIDSFGITLTYRQLLQAVTAFAIHLRDELETSTCVGILLPPSAAAVIANLALTVMGKIPVNLNYSIGQSAIDSMIKSAEIKTIITSERVLKKLNLNFSETLIQVEGIHHELSSVTKIQAWIMSRFFPVSEFEKCFDGMSREQNRDSLKVLAGLQLGVKPKQRPFAPATVVFTTGSTGDPKGVVLSHANILSNIQAIGQVGHVRTGETLMGVIPFFHSFGLTITMWAPLCLGCTVIYHSDPRDAHRIGDLCEQYKATTLICTPTMMAMYLRRCALEKFASLKECVLGGEKLKDQQRQEIDEKLRIACLEGYGLAETGPVLCCNVPGEVVLENGEHKPGNKPGTVGRPLPGTQIRIRDLKTGRILDEPGQEGLIEARGPQIMMGYMNKPEKTEEVLKDGWFNTGDIGLLDEDGFLRISGRLSQFSKIAGEMVPHLAIEDQIMRITGITSSEMRVTSVPDERRGERIVVLYSHLGCTPSAVVQELRKSGMPNLWIPEAQDFIHVNELPIFLHGKVDLRALRAIAEDHYPSISPSQRLKAEQPTSKSSKTAKINLSAHQHHP